MTIWWTSTSTLAFQVVLRPFYRRVWLGIQTHIAKLAGIRISKAVWLSLQKEHNFCLSDGCNFLPLHQFSEHIKETHLTKLYKFTRTSFWQRCFPSILTCMLLCQTIEFFQLRNRKSKDYRLSGLCFWSLMDLKGLRKSRVNFS